MDREAHLFPRCGVRKAGQRAKVLSKSRRPFHVGRQAHRFLLAEVAAGPETAHGRKVVSRDGREREPRVARGRPRLEPRDARRENPLGGEASAWRRQMVLGPSSEYCVLAESERELPGDRGPAWPLRTVVAPLSG